MIDRQAVETQGQSSRYDAPTLEEIRAGKAEEQAWQAKQLEREKDRQIARDAILDPIRARLAAGTVSAIRLQNITGLDDQKFKELMDVGYVSGWDSNGETERALADLAEWQEGDGNPTEDVSGYAMTPTFQTLQNLFSHAHQNRKLLAITGAWGIGKTQAAQYYAATHARTHTRPGAVRIQFNGTDCKPVAVLEKIRDALSAHPGSHQRGNVMKAIGRALRSDDFLILEECQRLGEALDVICSLYDDFGVGIAMIGNPVLSETIWGKRSSFGALASRANRYDFSATTSEDVDAWLAWHGLPEGLNATERARLVKTAIAIATQPGQNGGLRALADVFSMLQLFYPDQQITGELLAQSANSFKPAPPQ